MISAGVEGRIPYMTYPEPWRGPPKQPPELFLRPKPLPSTTRYNGVTSSSNYPNGNGTAGGRLVPPPARPIGKYPSPPGIVAPVNLAAPQAKDDTSGGATVDEGGNMSPYSPYTAKNDAMYRLFPGQFPHFPYPLCQQPYMLRTGFPPTPLSPMETFSPTAPTATSTFLSPPAAGTFSPPQSAALKHQAAANAMAATVLQQHREQREREKRTPPHSQGSPLAPPPAPLQPQPQPPTSAAMAAAIAAAAAFKVPSGKEGSLKHRILTRPEDNVRQGGPLDLQKPPEGRRRLQATMSPPSPRSPKRTINNTMQGNFNKGSLIQLYNGELRRIEDMRTEDFVMSAERSPELRLAESTVVKIEEGQSGTTTITLTYNQRRAQVEVESSSSHPYFVMGAGWASCDPSATHLRYGLKVQRLQVGDVLISLTPRDPPSATLPSSPPSAPPLSLPGAVRGLAGAATVMTTATGTAVTARQVSGSSTTLHQHHLGVTSMIKQPQVNAGDQSQPINLHYSGGQHPAAAPPLSPDSAAAATAARKRRWSLPEQICKEAEPSRRHRPNE